ncbi:MAG: aminotransferase class V-fold PLP-dependent enzyme [Candidatus Aminicenantes bacterium]|jgi:kynureninase
MTKTDWDLDKDLETIRAEFPILAKCVYLISNSLGAVPQQVREDLLAYFDLWSKQGVSAWSEEWWDLARAVGDRVASLLHAKKDSVAMMTNATQAHWIALSTQFLGKDRSRTKIVMTDHDFPSSLYAVQRISDFMEWNVQVVQSYGNPGIDVDRILDHIDDRTLCVATSHVYFKSGYIQDIAELAGYARRKGAWTVIDGYHAPGCIPVDLSELGVDFYIGGCLKWLCGGPGNAFLYVRPDLASRVQPSLTGWLAHRSPFSFEEDMAYTQGSYRFLSGTPPIPSLYTARAGLEIINSIGVSKIRQKSILQTQQIITNSIQRNFDVFSPEEDTCRGGAVSVHLPHAFQVKQALEKRQIKVDFRKGKKSEPDVIRIGPHFYTKDDEIHSLFDAIDNIYATQEFRAFPEEIKHPT